MATDDQPTPTGWDNLAMARRALPAGAWQAMEGAYDAWLAGGLPCGAALVGPDGVVVARGRNHAFDAATGTDVLETTPLAHAELNVLARVPTDRVLADDTLWSTQQPCAMCAAALQFCGVGTVRWIGADPAFVATDDPRSGVIVDPTVSDPMLMPWSIVANALFLLPAVERGNEARLTRNATVEPETVELARSWPRRNTDQLPDVLGALWSDVAALASTRAARLNR